MQFRNEKIKVLLWTSLLLFQHNRPMRFPYLELIFLRKHVRQRKIKLPWNWGKVFFNKMHKQVTDESVYILFTAGIWRWQHISGSGVHHTIQEKMVDGWRKGKNFSMVVDYSQPSHLWVILRLSTRIDHHIQGDKSTNSNLTATCFYYVLLFLLPKWWHMQIQGS